MLRTLLCSFTCGFSSILERFRRRFYEACFIVVFFFRAEDGIRDLYVTGVQTCALPISRRRMCFGGHPPSVPWPHVRSHRAAGERSEERRVGKECRSRWSPYH